jgi:hypothetical protein
MAAKLVDLLVKRSRLLYKSSPFHPSSPGTARAFKTAFAPPHIEEEKKARDSGQVLGEVQIVLGLPSTVRCCSASVRDANGFAVRCKSLRVR